MENQIKKLIVYLQDVYNGFENKNENDEDWFVDIFLHEAVNNFEKSFDIAKFYEPNDFFNKKNQGKNVMTVMKYSADYFKDNFDIIIYSSNEKLNLNYIMRYFAYAYSMENNNELKVLLKENCKD